MTDATLATSLAPEPGLRDFAALLKPRVMSLVVFTAAVGLLAAPGGVHPFIGLVAILCVAVGGGASGALNMWWDADIDAVMRRTAARPIPSGRVAAGDALALGVALSGLSVMLLGLAANWLAAGLLLFTILFYAVVYTMWLKRRTPQNIVIGGLAGALPPLVGWVAATGSIAWPPVLMVALIFVWTPSHFWSLALFMRGDYGRAGVPMLNETHGPRVTRNNILGYALALVPVSLALALSAVGGPVMLAASVVLNVLYLRACWRVWRRGEDAAEADRFAAERAAFRVSLWVLFLHFGALLADAALRTTWGG